VRASVVGSKGSAMAADPTTRDIANTRGAEVGAVPSANEAVNEAVNEAISGWASVEEKFVHALNGKPFESTTSSIPESERVGFILQITSNLFAAKHDALKDGANQDGVLLAAALEHEVSRMESIRELLRVHDEMVQTIDSITFKLTRLEEKRVTSGDIVAELKLLLDEKQTCLAAFYKGLVYFTLPLCAKLRAYTFKRALAYLGVATLCSHSKIAAEADIFFSKKDKKRKKDKKATGAEKKSKVSSEKATIVNSAPVVNPAPEGWLLLRFKTHIYCC
jgi:hypothetical protein